MQKTAIERFNDKIKISEYGCHEWTARLSEKGYGVLACRENGKKQTWQAHRWIYHYTFNGIPEEMYVLHKCDNRKCVNPNHLYIGTQLDNMRDMWERNRGVRRRGEDHTRASFTNEQVSNIKALALIGLQPKLIASIRNSNINTIWGIIRGKSWTHIEAPVIIGRKSETIKKVAQTRKSSIPVNMLSKEGTFIRRFKSAAHAACFLGRCSTGFREVINGRQPTWGGFKWEYADHNAKTNKTMQSRKKC